MTKHECELMRKLMDENEQLRQLIRLLEGQQAWPQYVPVPQPQIWPDPGRITFDPLNPVYQTSTNGRYQ